MIEWFVTLMEILGIVCALMGLLVILLMFFQFTKYLINRTQTKVPRRTDTMSKEAREGVTFNDIFMFMIAVPLVLLWVGFAGFVIHTGLNNSAVLENIEAYTTLIAILGGPALLIIKDALDVWKQEQAEKTAFYKVKAQSVIDYNDAVLKQAQEIESKQQDQEHKMESKK